MRYFYPNLFKINPAAKTFLDLGCGQGFISLYAAARGLYVDSVDINTEVPSSLQDIANVTYTAADLNTWKSTKKYDIIVAHQIIHFLPKEYVLRKLLPTLCDLLNPGGVLEISAFTTEETLDVPTKYTLEEVVKVLAVSDVEIMKQEAISYNGMHRKLGAHTFHELQVIVKKLK
jgi:trans-aconitate methyltransferase